MECVPYIQNMTHEIKRVNGQDYLYDVAMVWDSEHRKRHKVSRYIGKMVDGKPVRVRNIVSVKGIYEIGHLELLWKIMPDLIGTLRKEFPDDYMRMLTLAFNRVIYPMPLKSVKSWVEKTQLAKIITEISPKSLSAMLSRIGSHQERQKSVFRSLMKKNEIIAYDTSTLFSYSPGISMAEFGHNPHDLMLPMIKVILGFSRSRNEPCYIRSDPGSRPDIDTLRTSQNDVPQGTLFVMDREFIDDDNFDTMDTGGIYFITPMRRNSRRIDYTAEMKDFFMFRKRAIKYHVKKAGKYDLHLYEDLLMKAYEENEYYSRISEGKHVDFNLERAGKFAILTNAGEKSQSIFELYKFRNEVEEAFDIFKNLLLTDTPSLRDDDTLRGYLFVSFISLIGYYRILKLLKEKHVNSRISVKDAILQLSKIYLTDVGNRTIVAEIPKKSRELAELLGLEPDLFPKNVPS